MNSARSVVWLADVDTESEHFGTHSKQLARLIQAKFPLVPGFVISPYEYNVFLQENNLYNKINQLFSTISFERPESLMQAEFHIKQLFERALLSDVLYDDLAYFYDQLGDEVTLEIHETGKHGRKHAAKTVISEEGLISEVINLWSEMFTGKALWHRHQSNVNHFTNRAEIIVRKKIQGDTIEGNIFTIDPGTHAKDKLVIVTSHPHVSDEYVLSKKNLTILDRSLKHKHPSDKLTMDEILAIAKLARRVEEHLYFPQKISWLIADNALYMQSVTTISDFPVPQPTKKTKLPLARGKGLTPAIGTGTVTVVHTATALPSVSSNHVVVIQDLPAKHLKNLKKIKGLIIENHPHNETVTLIRQHGIPAVCNVKHATKNLKNGHTITVHGGKGEIYSGGFIN